MYIGLYVHPSLYMCTTYPRYSDVWYINWIYVQNIILQKNHRTSILIQDSHAEAKPDWENSILYLLLMFALGHACCLEYSCRTTHVLSFKSVNTLFPAVDKESNCLNKLNRYPSLESGFCFPMSSLNYSALRHLELWTRSHQHEPQLAALAEQAL
jgi:hypothetical protein